MEREIIETGELLDNSGFLTGGGWSRSMLLSYDRSKIPTWRRLWRLKEWDYYLFGNDRVQIALTVADNGYMGMVSASVIQLDKECEHTYSKIIPFTFGSFNMPPATDNGDIMYRSKEDSVDFCKSPGKRYIRARMEHFDDVRPLYINVVLEQPPMDSLCIAVPFDEKPDCFYYNHKINCMPASGTVVYGADTFELSSENSFGCLDWGRGVWPYDNKWIWCSASGKVNGLPFGLNMGDGFGDRSAAGENIVYYDGVGYKFEKIIFDFDSRNYLKPWKFTSADHRLNLEMTPIIDRHAAPSALGVITSVQHQVFGRYSGTINLGNGTTLTIDGVTGFAEEVTNKW